jgi:hypothetical protein
MVYNPKFFAGLEDAGKKDVLKHEFYHIVYQHVTGGRFAAFRDMDPQERKLHNIAMDLSINGHLPNLPEMACFPGKGPFAHLPAGKSAEWYLSELRKMQKDQPPEGGGGGKGEGGGGTPGEGQPGGGFRSCELSQGNHGWDYHQG